MYKNISNYMFEWVPTLEILAVLAPDDILYILHIYELYIYDMS
jgi:hypothetical protein